MRDLSWCAGDLVFAASSIFLRHSGGGRSEGKYLPHIKDHSQLMLRQPRSSAAAAALPLCTSEVYGTSVGRAWRDEQTRCTHTSDEDQTR